MKRWVPYLVLLVAALLVLLWAAWLGARLGYGAAG